MSGRSIGMFFGMGSGMRVAGITKFIPAHINANGKKVSHKIDVPVFVNSNRGTNPDGSQGRTSAFTVSAWGDLARKMALSLSKGRALDVLVELESYKGRVWVGNAAGAQAVMGADGQPVLTTKTSCTILRMVFGEESANHIAFEIETSRRPADWANPGSPNFQLFKNELQRRLQIQYVQGQNLGFVEDAQFGYARVIIPQGSRILTPQEAATPNSQYNAGAISPAQTGGFVAQQPAAPVDNTAAVAGQFTQAPVAPAAPAQGATWTPPAAATAPVAPAPAASPATVPQVAAQGPGF